MQHPAIQRIDNRIAQLQREICRLETERDRLRPPEPETACDDLCAAVRARIDARGITIKAAGEQMGLTRQALSKILHGRTASTDAHRSRFETWLHA